MRPARRRQSVWDVDEPETFADRLVTAVVSVFAAALTCAGLATITVLMVGDLGAPEFWTTFFYWSAGFVTLAALVGFIAGPKRAAELWGRIWGTDSLEPGREPVFLLAMIIMLALVALWMDWD